MEENRYSGLRTIARLAARCVKIALGFALAGSLGLVVVITLMHIYETRPRMYAALFGIMAIGTFVYMTVRLAKQGDDNGKEGLA